MTYEQLGRILMFNGIKLLAYLIINNLVFSYIQTQIDKEEG